MLWLKTPKYIYVFEFKLNGTAEEALKQIDEKGYLIPYKVDHREVVKALAWSLVLKARNLSRWLVEIKSINIKPFQEEKAIITYFPEW